MRLSFRFDLICLAAKKKKKKLSFVTQTNNFVSPILVSSSHLSPSQRYYYRKKQIQSTLNDNLCLGSGLRSVSTKALILSVGQPLELMTGRPGGDMSDLCTLGRRCERADLGFFSNS